VSTIDEIEARVRPTICPTHKMGSGGPVTSIEGRILEADFWVLLGAARDGELDRGTMRVLQEEIARLERRVKKGWRPVETAPQDGVVDLWGSAEREGGAGCRWPDCWWGPAGLSDEVLPEGWFCRLGAGTLPFRIWPTHWRPVPGRPA
jgi:hypothetical protein